MNLNNMFKDASLNNLQWLQEGTFTPQSKDNDSKDDLELQWNYGDIGNDYSNSPEAAKQPLPTDSTKEIVQKMRDYLNQGMPKNDIIILMVQSYPQDAVVAALKQWKAKNMHKLEGIVGRVAVDVRGYKTPKDAMRSASKSPYKKFIKYVVGYNGDNVIHVTENSKTLLASNEAESTGNATDDFFASENKDVKANVYCKDLMMPLLARSFDLDDSYADSTLVEMSASNLLTEKEVADISSQPISAYAKVKKAFLLIDEKKKLAKAKSYKGKVDASAFKIKKADTPIEISNEAPKGVEITDVAPPKPEEVIVPVVSSLKNVKIEKDSGLQVKVGKEKPKSLNFKVKKADLELDIEKKPEESLDVMAECFKEAEFEGIDNVELDEEKKAEGMLDVDERSDFSF